MNVQISKSTSRKTLSDNDRILYSCKDGRVLQFGFNSITDCRKVFEGTKAYAFSSEFFAYSHHTGVNKAASETTTPSNAYNTGWNVYDPIKEFTRLGCIDFTVDGKPSAWRLSTINNDYAISDTYPKDIIIPRHITDDVMIECAKFRSKGRMPACVWVHPITGASITRSSQPRTGMAIDGGARSRSAGDEAVVKGIWQACIPRDRGPLIIADCRPKTNALANRAQGFGYEGDNYTNIEILFLNIHNIHVMRDSCNKLVALCSSRETTAAWGVEVEATDWLMHIRNLLDCAVNMARYVNKGTSVFVHCSDGWDRTAQLCSLMELLLDPYYRTYRGFQVLVSKEWLSFGHRFQERTGHGEANEGDQHRSPVFLQFLDCVYQLLRLFPRAFEFLPCMLVEIADSLYSCRFGTFLGNTERERSDIAQKTESLWVHLDNHQRRFGNPLYVPHEVLLPSNATVLRNVILWSDYYLRFTPVKSTMPSAFPATLPKLGPITLTDTADKVPFMFHSVGNSLAAHSVGVPLSNSTSQSDDEWTIRTLLNEVRYYTI